MRVCLLLPVLDAFKGANHLPLLAACKDVQFTILTGRTKPSEPDLPPNVKVVRVPGKLGFYYYGITDFLFARNVLGAYPPDDAFWKQFNIIHLNQTMGPSLARLRKTGIPVLFFIHHPVTADLQVALEESSLLQGLRWRARYTPLRLFQSRLCRLFPVATVSRTSAERIAHDYDCDAAKITVVQNGIDTDAFTPALDETEFDVVALGSFLHPRKGFRYLVQVYRRLGERGFKIADVGRRTDAQRNELASIKNIRVFGTVDHPTLLSLVQRSATLISTSLFEGFGLSLIEALACGRPAFAFAGGAVPEVLSSIDPSLVVPLRDVEALVAHVTEFLALPTEERHARGERYRREVIDRYALTHSATALQALYRSLSHPQNG